MLERVALVCPRCSASEVYELPSAAVMYRHKCLRCKKDFASRIIKVKSKRGQQNKQSNYRTVSIRGTHLDGTDDLVEFVKVGVDDIEAGSGDLVSLGHIVGKKGVIGPVVVVTNHEIGRAWQTGIGKKRGCFGCGALALAGLLVGGAAMVVGLGG